MIEMLNRAFSELRYEVLALIAGAAYDGFDDFWEPFTLAVGPAGRGCHLAPLSRQIAVASGAPMPRR